MLQRTDILLLKIREQADISDDNSIPDKVLLDYVNDAQKEIQRVVFSADQANNCFVQWKSIAAISNTLEYALPNDVYAETSIIGVYAVDSNNRILYRYDKSAFGQRTSLREYSVKNRSIVFSSYPDNDILVAYNYRYPSVALRIGKVSSVADPAVTLASVDADVFTESRWEYVTAVDKYGAQISNFLYIDSFSSPAFTLDGTLSSITSDHYLVPGRDATSHSELPEECEPYLKEFVKKKCFYHINSKKIDNAYIFSKAEKDAIADIFANKHSDVEYPYIVDTDYLEV